MLPRVGDLVVEECEPIHAMGVQGDIKPFLSLFHERVLRKVGVKDTRRFDERSLKLMLMTYVSLSHLQTGAKPAKIEAAFAQAAAQVARYASDAELLPLLLDRRELKAGMLVFIGKKRILFRPWPQEPKAPRARARAPRPRPARAGKKKRA